MTASPSTKKAIASSLLLGLAGLVALLNSSSTKTRFIPSLRNLEGELSAFSGGFKPTGFYTTDIGFFTVKPWGPATWSVDFTTKSIKKLNSLLYSADGEENHKGSILCTDELCQGHGKATTAFLTGTDGAVTATLEVAADAFEVCITCPPGEFFSPQPNIVAVVCQTDIDADCLDEVSFAPTGPVFGFLRTGRIFYRNQEEPMPNIVRLTLRFMCAPMAG